MCLEGTPPPVTPPPVGSDGGTIDQGLGKAAAATASRKRSAALLVIGSVAETRRAYTRESVTMMGGGALPEAADSLEVKLRPLLVMYSLSAVVIDVSLMRKAEGMFSVCTLEGAPAE